MALPAQLGLNVQHQHLVVLYALSCLHQPTPNVLLEVSQILKIAGNAGAHIVEYALASMKTHKLRAMVSAVQSACVRLLVQISFLISCLQFHQADSLLTKTALPHHAHYADAFESHHIALATGLSDT